jgi:putative transposase
MKERTGRHVVYQMHVHLVFVTKKRGKVFTQAHIEALRSIFDSLCKSFETELLEFNGEQDHVHLLVMYPPKVSVSVLVNYLKGISSRLLKQLYPEMRDFWSIKESNNALWSPSYFAGSIGGATLSILKKYIEKQNSPY